MTEANNLLSVLDPRRRVPHPQVISLPVARTASQSRKGRSLTTSLHESLILGESSRPHPSLTGVPQRAGRESETSEERRGLPVHSNNIYLNMSKLHASDQITLNQQAMFHFRKSSASPFRTITPPHLDWEYMCSRVGSRDDSHRVARLKDPRRRRVYVSAAPRVGIKFCHLRLPTSFRVQLVHFHKSGTPTRPNIRALTSVYNQYVESVGRSTESEGEEDEENGISVAVVKMVISQLSTSSQEA
ncbi:hypothetical protein CROQUDRAFT_107993 [Cronartium quercuum f. sp. fusiforme G11]|uniref:Uncharacterized protein n=1 Tax=Cronartium quercuum f. sp. fusiforme G11 TaxID=708437 RepID=A0A9P6TC17_9BASI|nr:hypothetical protein CROQUDRAFT_107993 [Cronartium quercuum f. sp. fusiforme G11]